MSVIEYLKSSSEAVMWSCIIVGLILGCIYGFWCPNMITVLFTFMFAGVLHLIVETLQKYEVK